MNTRVTSIIVLTMIAIALIAGAVLWDHLPAQMPSHWNVYDQVDGTIPRIWGVLLMPLVTLGMFALFLVVPNIDPLKANLAQFRDTFNLFIVFIVAFMLYIHALTLAWSLGYTNFHMSTAMLPMMGLLFIFIGYMMRKAKRNFFIGIRTPWTLSSDTVWDKTHQLGSVLFMLSGALALLGGFFGGILSLLMMLIPLTGSTIILIVYSYVLYRNEVRQ
ncbi:MAG: SdpI family protein [Anaerolineales bacterium]